ncbi:hypothetical protein BGZ95_002991 [Linnemannia exigua]|uniref:Uncharacterized protein n=1 Tax=Linnemannia exigua TaxID=604196 RepID=A0AAD4DIB5_9FUNG|nr:hypothetical protein BGZ95_002991 [Linnemannia exigua]
MKFTVALAMMVALTITLIAGSTEAATRAQCTNACGNEYLKCVNSGKTGCDRELGYCISDCDG